MRDFRGKGSVTRHVVFFALLLFYFTSRSVFRKRLFTRLLGSFRPTVCESRTHAVVFWEEIKSLFFCFK